MDRDVLEIQKLYPRIYVACHTEHVKAASSEHGLSAREATILAHLSDDGLTSAARLAKHLNVTRIVVSEALAKLVDLGYVRVKNELHADGGQRLLLTDSGLVALSKSSVLDYDKLTRVIGRLTADERAKVIEGLAILADAASNRRGELGESGLGDADDDRSEH